MEFWKFGSFAGWQTAALRPIESHCCGPGPLLRKVFGILEGLQPLRAGKRQLSKLQENPCCGSEVPAGDGVWRVWRVLEGLERLERFGGFAGWQTAALKAHRKSLLWPWPWGACWGSGLGPGPGPGPGVPVGEVALALGCMLGKVFGILEVWILCSFESVKKVIAVDLRCLLGTVFGGFGGFWRVWSVWSVWRILEGLRAGKRQL